VTTPQSECYIPKKTPRPRKEKFLPTVLSQAQIKKLIDTFVTATILPDPVWIFDNCVGGSQNYRLPPMLGGNKFMV